MSQHSVDDYLIVWIAALPIERSAALQMLNDEHSEPDDFVRHEIDENTYDWGRIHNHNVIITSLPSTKTGKVSAANTIGELLASLPSIKIALLVGIGAGLPSANHDIRLGDVVVGTPDKQHGGVVQYDFGKAKSDGWELKGSLSPPPAILLKAMGQLQARHEAGQFLHTSFLDKAFQRNEHWASLYSRTDLEDNLHDSSGERIIQRHARSTSRPEIHYGLIASGDTVVKDVAVRDQIFHRLNGECLCIEMEAAGLSQKIPCLVIRGISDYADKYKNDRWHRYASATAAAFAKELLLYVPSFLGQAQDRLGRSVGKIADMAREKINNLLKVLDTCPSEERKDRNPEALDGTCQWFIRHPKYHEWLSKPRALLWVSADPGCGKSTLARYLIDKVLNVNKDKIICYFFFKDDFEDQRNCTFALSSVLRQLLVRSPLIMRKYGIPRHEQDGDRLATSFGAMWDTLVRASHDEHTREVICLFDAMDECQRSDRTLLLETIIRWFESEDRGKLKFLLTSRPHGDIKDSFYELVRKMPTVHLSGESENEAALISREIDIVIRHRISLLSRKRELSNDETAYLLERFLSTPQRTYLWAHLTLNIVENTPGLTRGYLKHVLTTLPRSVDEAYEKMLNQSPDHQRTRALLQIILAASRPLSLAEASTAIAVRGHMTRQDVAESVEPAPRFKQSIRDLCGMLVIVVDDYVYFLHQTVREFLVCEQRGRKLVSQNSSAPDSQYVWRFSVDMRCSHRSMLRKCMWYMTSDSWSDDSLQAFWAYSTTSWVLHFRVLDMPETDPWQRESYEIELVRQFIDDNKSITGHHWIDRGSYDAYCFVEQLPFKHALVTSAYFGLHSVTRAIVSELVSDSARSDPLTSSLMAAALYAAVLENHVAIAELLLVNGANPNLGRYAVDHLGEWQYDIRKFQGWTPLQMACKNNHIQLARLLISHGASINPVTCDKKYNLLHLLLLDCVEGKLIFDSTSSKNQTIANEKLSDFVQLLTVLVQKVHSPHSLSIEGFSPANGVLGMGCLIRHPTDDTSRHPAIGLATKHLPVQWYTFNSLPAEQLRRVIEPLFLGQHINKPCNEHGQTWLQVATLSGLDATMISLLNLGADPSIRDKLGHSIVHYAAIGHSASCLRLAIEITDVDGANAVGQTALMAAAVLRRQNIVQILLDEGANPNLSDSLGRTALMYASGLQPECFQIQLKAVSREAGIHMEARGTLSDWEADKEDEGATIARLCSHGADINGKDMRGRTCLHFAVESENVRRMELILELGAKINAQDRDGDSVLMLLAERMRIGRWHYTTLECSRFLLSRGADPSLKNSRGLNALQYYRSPADWLFRKQDPSKYTPHEVYAYQKFETLLEEAMMAQGYSCT